MNGAGAEGIGINYALLGNNLPSLDNMVALLQSRKITTFRLLDPNHAVLAALNNSSIVVIRGTLNNDHSTIFATTWVRTNVMLYL